MRFVSLLMALVFSLNLNAYEIFSANFPYAPDPNQTDGSVCNPRNPDFTEYRYPERIPYCTRNVSRETKAMVYRNYGVPSRCRGEYTVDHFIPLSIGGTNSPDNLWPEHKSVKQARPDLEMQVYRQLASGKISQAQAIARVRQAKWNPPTNAIDLSGACQ